MYRILQLQFLIICMINLTKLKRLKCKYVLSLRLKNMTSLGISHTIAEPLKPSNCS